MTTPRFDKADADRWQSYANCLGLDADLFFPERGEPQSAAMAVCRGCSVTAECLTYALDNGMTLGIWGGTTAKARRLMVSERAAKGMVVSCVTCAAPFLARDRRSKYCPGNECRNEAQRAARARYASARRQVS